MAHDDKKAKKKIEKTQQQSLANRIQKKIVKAVIPVSQMKMHQLLVHCVHEHRTFS